MAKAISLKALPRASISGGAPSRRIRWGERSAAILWVAAISLFKGRMMESGKQVADDDPQNHRNDGQREEDVMARRGRSSNFRLRIPSPRAPITLPAGSRIGS